MRARLHAGLVSALAAVVLSSASLARPPASQEPPVFGTQVSVVAVPVFVTDRKGNSVAGLTAADFEVEDQGKKAEIVAFQSIDAGADAATEPEAGPLQAAARRQFVFLFDLAYSTPTGIMRARDAAIRLARENLSPRDLAAVATCSPRGFRILVTFTPDRSQIERAITSLGLVETQAPARDSLNIAYDMGVARWGPGIGPPPDDTLNSLLVEFSRQIARADQAQYRQQVDGYLDGLRQLVETLDAVQGRKQVILLSAGFDSTVVGGARGQERVDASEAVVSGRLWEVPTDRHFGDSAASGSLETLFKAVAATDAVIHTVDVTGMGAAANVADRLPQPLGRGRDTLAQIASNTGGRFVADANDLQAGLAGVVNASRHFYVLGVAPVERKAKADSLRRIRVRVRGDGLSVSHRRGYLAAGPERNATAASVALQNAEAIAKGLSGGPIALRALAVPYRNASGALALPVILQIDGRPVLQGAKAAQLGLDVYGYAFDGDGRILDTLVFNPVVDLGAVRQTLEAKGLQLITSFAVPEGTVDLRFLVREKATNRAGSLRLRLEVPDFAGEAMVVSPPLAMDDPRTRLVVPAPSRALPSLEIPFRLADVPFTAEALPALTSGKPREICVFVWPGAAPDGARPALAVEALLEDAAGGTHKLPLAAAPRVVRDADGTERYVVTLVPGRLAAGQYRLRLDFVDPASGRTARSEGPVRIE